jgi:hypothetical protein
MQGDFGEGCEPPRRASPLSQSEEKPRVRFYFAVGGGTTSCSLGLSRIRLNSSSL